MYFSTLMVYHHSRGGDNDRHSPWLTVTDEAGGEAEKALLERGICTAVKREEDAMGVGANLVASCIGRILSAENAPRRPDTDLAVAMVVIQLKTVHLF